MSATREIDIYLQLARKTNGYSNGKMTIVSCGVNPPATRRPKTVVVKIKVRVPDRAFDPASIPALLADIPLDHLVVPENEIAVVVDDANEED
jgi:hypothetical protein